MAKASGARGDSQGGDVAVPWEIVGVFDARGRGLVGAYWGCERR